ncbi:putative fatty-acid--CoA ligase [Caenibius tardaugens NBRC 16725]|uniref:3-methylmercaptopropionyl-CoA ligase n=1 Tax=Caenibius tardaugens NBRC 16725 TaxID=1219035 RepID=U2ZV73_9SPHN|nr:long-chain-fatty-acid--CoA ligase [Caenibius tardaugens]AZI36621.1 long-chain-fatty-acid--CoA ligase [Caenibius tardaugens NBRC 16725]GAD49274.1 putative fatty-acid--CoA ligase [Caenibius tardaugens NBRC 16725]
MAATVQFHDQFDFLARTQPDQICIVDDRRRLTFSEASRDVNRFANGLLSLGLVRGDRFGFLARNCAEMWFMYLAAARTGIVPIPLNYRLAPAEWLHILNDAGAKALIVGPGYDAAVDEIIESLREVRWRVSFDRATDDAPPFAQWLEAQSDARPDMGPSGEDIFYQMYTSGTTGLPKGVLVTHANFAANLYQSLQFVDHLPDHRSVALVVTPLYHAAAVWIAAFCTARGMTIHLKTDFDPVDVVNTLERERVAFTFLVPAMIQACLTQVPDIDARDWSHLEMLMYGASPIAEDVLRRAVRVFGCDVYQAYGMTETTAILTLLGPAAHRRALAGEEHLLLACGQPLPGTEIRIVDGSGAPVPDGASGQIIARGPQIVPGYWRMPDATAAFLADGWAHTGDAGARDAEGFVYIRDRIKDMVVSGGENIYPREVENALFAHPDVVDAAVIGVPDDRFGEALLALIVAAPGKYVDAEEIIAFCRNRLGGYKVPRRIEQVDVLPRNASGKVLKQVLREPYWRDQNRAVG